MNVTSPATHTNSRHVIASVCAIVACLLATPVPSLAAGACDMAGEMPAMLGLPASKAHECRWADGDNADAYIKDMCSSLAQQSMFPGAPPPKTALVAQCPAKPLATCEFSGAGMRQIVHYYEPPPDGIESLRKQCESSQGGSPGKFKAG